MENGNNNRKNLFLKILILIAIVVVIILLLLKGCNKKYDNPTGIKITNINEKVDSFNDDTIFIKEELLPDEYTYNVTIHNYLDEDYYLYKVEISDSSIEYDKILELLKAGKDTKIKLNIKLAHKVKDFNIKFYYGKLKEIKIGDETISSFGDEKIKLPVVDEKEGYSVIGYTDVKGSDTVKYTLTDEYDLKDGTVLYPVYKKDIPTDNPNTDTNDNSGNNNNNDNNNGSSEDNTPSQETAKKYVVTFDYKNGKESTKKEVTYKEAYGDLPGANKEGYTFDGWYLGNTLITSSSIVEITSDVTLEAKYTIIKYGIKYNLDGGIASNPSYYTIETETFTLNNPTLAGSTFVGWTGSNGDSPALIVKIDKGSKGSKEYTANYSENEKVGYKVIHRKQKLDEEYESGEIETKEAPYGIKVTPAVKTYEGFISPSTQTVEVKQDGSTEIEYLYKREKYNLVLPDTEDIDLEHSTPAGSYPYETEITLVAKDKDGYNFNGWSNGESNQTITFEITGDINIYPTYEAKTYEIVFNANGGTGEMENQSVKYDEEKELIPCSYTKVGHNFIGWNTKQDGTGTAYEDKATVKNLTTESSIILYAQYITHEYTITFDSKGGDTVLPITRRYQEKYGELPSTSKTGYNFLGWYLGETKIESEMLYENTSDITLEAKYDIITYHITYDLDEGTAPNPTEYNIETATFTLNNPTKAGYTFSGWTGSNGDNLQTSVTINKGTTGDLNYTAHYSTNPNTQYKVLHKYQNYDLETYTAEEEILYGATGSKITPALKERHGFINPELQEIEIKGDGSTKLTYTYLRDSFELAYTDKENIDLENSTEEGTYLYETEITIVAKEKEGYTFDHWSNGVDTPVAVFNLEDDLNVYPIYEANKYVVVYNPTSGTGSMADQEMTYDITDNLRKNTFTKEGYNFAGWNTKEDGTGNSYEDEASVKNLKTSGNIILYAMWEAKTNTPYKVIHKKQKLTLDGYEEEVENLTGTTDEEVTPSVRTYEGFTKPTPETVTISGDGKTEVVYVYDREIYTLSFEDNENVISNIPAGNYPYGTEVELTAKPKEGYTFVGWDNGSENNPYVFELTGDITIKPVYNPNTDTAYKVIHKKQKLTLDGYDEEVENLTGTTDEEVTPLVKTYEGFTKPTPETVTISGDGNTEVVYVYDREIYTLSFEDNENVISNIPAGNYPYGTEVELTPKEKPGYVFAGWTDGSLSNPYTFELDENKIIKPLYTAKSDTPYKVIHKKQNIDLVSYTEEVENLTGTTDAEITPEVRTYDGFTSPSTQTTTIKGDGSTIVNYIYTRNTYRLTVGNPEYVVEDKTGDYLYESVITLTAKDRQGYEFAGWSTGEDTKTITVTIGSSDITVTPIYTNSEDTKYKVIHKYRNLDDTFEEEEVIGTGTTGSTIPAPLNPKYGFVSPEIQNITITADGKASVTYIYEREEYAFSILDREYLDEESTPNGTYPYETEITLKAVEREGYDFKWSDDVEGLERTFNLTEAKTLSLVYTARTDTKYKVLHLTQKIDGTYEERERENLEGTTDEEVTPSVKTYEGFTSPSTQTVTINGNGLTTVTYEYTRNKYELTIEDSEYVLEDKSGFYYYEEEVSLTAIEREGYNFAGWSTGETTKTITITIGTEDVTTKPLYTAKDDTRYKVIHKYRNLDNTFEEEEVIGTGTTGTTVPAAVKPKTGFISPGSQNITITADGNASVTYVYEREKYTFSITDRTYLTTDSTPNGTYAYETPIIIKAVNRPGYNFKWSDNVTDYERTFNLTDVIELSLVYDARIDTPYKVIHKKQNITLDGYDIEETESLTGETDSSITPAVKTYEGFTSPSVQTITISGEGNTEVIYQYTRNSYTLTIENPEYVEENKSGTYPYGTEITIKAIERPGYDFAGWSNGASTKQITITVGADNISIKPLYTAKDDTTYTIIHRYKRLNGGYDEEPYVGTGTTGTTVPAALKPKTGFISPSQQNITINGDGSSTLTYTYEREEYAFSITDREYLYEESTANGTYAYETEITLKAKERVGYTFAWSDGITNYERSFELTEATTLSLVYTPNTYEVVFNKNNENATGEMINESFSYDETKALTKNSFVLVGYDFLGWTINQDGTGAFYVDEDEVSNLTSVNDGTVNLYGKWKSRTDTPYKVIHKKQNITLDGYDVEETENLTGTTDEEVTPGVKTYTGFVSPSTQTVTINGNGLTTVTYLYDREMYDFTLSNTTDVTSTKPTGRYPYGTVITLTANQKEGYKFTRWSNGETSNPYTLTLDSDLDITPIYEELDEDVTYTVIHQKQKVTLDGYDEEEREELTGTAGTDVTPSVKTYTGFISPSTQTVTIALDGSTVVTYNYNREMYTLSYDGSADITTSTPAGEYPYGKEITITANQKAGYTFDKWSNEEISNPYTFNLTGNVTIKPLYIPNTNTLYKVIHRKQNVDLTTYSDEVEERFGTTDSSVTPAVKTYSGFTSPSVQTATIAGDGSTEVIYIYTRNMYTLSFDNSTDITSNIPAGTYPYGTIVSINANDKEGYAFTSWSDGETSNPYTFALIESKTVTPIYDSVSYEVTFDANGGTGDMLPQTITKNVKTKLSKNLYTNFGSIFDSWNTESDGTGDSYFDEEEITRNTNITLYAIWAPQDKVARIGNTYYTSLVNAINAVPTTGEETEVVLLKDTAEKAEIASTKRVILDLQNHTLSNNGNANVIVNNGSLKLYNGKITTNVAQGAINNNSTGTLVMDNVSIIVTKTGSKQALYNDGGNLTINGNCYLSSESTQRAALHNLNNGIINLNSGTVISTGTYALYNEKGTLNIGTKDGNINQESPVIQGKTYGIAANNTYNFYDGIIKGITYHVGKTSNTGNTPTVSVDTDETKMTEIETDSQKVLGQETISGSTYYTIKLEKTTPAPSTYTVTFNPNGGNTSETTRTVTANNTLGNLPTANRSNSITKGWYTAATGGTEVTSDTVITGNITYYAQYYSTMDQANITPIRVAMKIGDERTITITGPEDMESYTITSNDTDVATVSGNTVTAVGMGETTLTVTGNESGISKSIEVEVISSTRYKVTFNSNGGTISETTRYVYEGQPIGVLPTGTKDDDVVVGWYTGLVDGIKINKDYIVNSNLVLYPKWGEPSAEFDEGKTVNAKMKKLAGDELNETRPEFTSDSNITSILKSSVAPDISLMTEDNIISSDDSLLPIYAWYDNGTLYWWTNTNNVYLNEDSSYLFAYLKNMSTIDLSLYNSSNVTDMSWMFGESIFEELDITKLDTGNVTDMNSMFLHSTVPSLDFSKSDLSKVEDMSSMFVVSNIQSIDFSGVETSSLKDMSWMFNTSHTEELDLSDFDTSKVIDMSAIFSNSPSLKRIDISNWDFSGITSMSHFFGSYLNQLEEIKLDNINTSTITDMSSMFYNCSSLKSIDLSDLDTENVTDVSSMFEGCSSLTELDLSSFDTSKITSIGNFASGCTSLEILNMSNFDLRNIGERLFPQMCLQYDTALKTVILDNAIFAENMQNAFSLSTSIETISLNNVDTSLTTNMNSMFYNCSSLKSIDLSDLDTENVTNLGAMFSGCSSLTELDLSMFDTSKITTFGSFVYGCTSLETLNMSNFDLRGISGALFSQMSISSATSLKTVILDNSIFGESMSYFFTSSDSIETISLNNVDTSLTTYMSNLFVDCPLLTELDLSDFDTSNVTYMMAMFNDCSNLTTIYVSDDFVVDQVTNSTQMFDGCTSLVGGNGTVYDANHIDKEYAHYDGGELYPGYFTAKDISSKYEITFKDNNKILFKRYITKGNRVGSLPVVTKEGYDFVGWYSSNVDGIEITEEYVPQDNINIYARYIKKVTVSFDTDGGSEVPSQTINYGSTATRPATNPIKELHKFDDWYTDDTYTTKFDFTTPITSDTIIYAHFEELKVCANNENITRLSENTCSNNENITVGDGIVCKRAVKLHEETCSQTDGTYYCSGAGYTESGSKGTSTITYGSCGTSGTLSSGDAFTCDVNGDGNFDELTERFYYVSDYYDTSAKEFDTSTAVLIYYNNVTSGVSCNKNTYAYDSSGENWHGPLTVMKQLPTTSQWSNVSLKNTTRQILTETGTTSTSGGTLPEFDYSGYAARFITAQELNSACGITIGNYRTGELDSCNYVMENTIYAKSTIGSYGGWLESPLASNSFSVWRVYGSSRFVIYSNAYFTGGIGARPAIEVPKSKIEYGASPSYTVTLNANGGSVNPTSITVNIGDAIGTLPEPTPPTGKSFTGWYTELTGGIEVTSIYVPNTDIEIYARYNSTYTVSFDTDGGSTVASQIVNHGGVATKPLNDPTKSGYTFDDWYTDDTYTTKFDFDTAITEDTTIYAHFEELKVCANNENITRLSENTCSNNENITVGNGIVCKRAVKLHEETCSQTDGGDSCSGAGYTTSGSKGTSTITYGSCGTSGTLTSGDAFTCDVNGDEKFDELTERFYYVSDYYDTSTKTFDDSTAVLIYYNNVTSGVSCNKNTFAYSTQADIQTVDPSRTSYDNWHGPLTVMKQLPTTSQWSNVSLKSDTRAILAEYQSTHDSPTTTGGTLPTDFSYEGYAARLLTAKELMAGCNLTEVGRYTIGELDNCNYVMENTKYAKSSIGSYGPWLETPRASYSGYVWFVIDGRSVSSYSANYANNYGARPAIEVPKSKIEYGASSTYTVTLNANGGSVNTTSITVNIGDAIGTLPEPTPPTGKSFTGWYTELTGGIEVTSTYVPNTDIEIYAQYEELKVCANNENITTLSENTCSNNENITVGDGIVCKRAVKLHEETCSQTDGTFYCSAAGYTTSGSKGTSTITYGSCGTSGTLTSGDAFTCDVNGDGDFDELTERFYYVSDYYDTSAKEFDTSTAVLIYYNNVTSGVSCNRNTFAYSTTVDIQTVDPSITSYDNWHGPLTVMKQLPTTSQWSNISLKNDTRAILAENQSTHDSPTTYGGTLPTDFSYTGYAARLLTAKELMTGCNLTEVGRYIYGVLDSCNYVMENTKYAKSSIRSLGHWLETPRASNSSGVWYVFGNYRGVDYGLAGVADNYGARPAIEVPKSKIEYGANNKQMIFNANGGTGTMTNQSFNPSFSITINNNTFTREKYIFTGWNTREDGTGDAYTDGDTIPANTYSNDVTLYAQWVKHGWDFENESTWTISDPLTDQKWLYYDNGTKVMNGWINVPGRMDNTGALQWFFMKDGYMYMGWLEENGNWYFFSWFDRNNNGYPEGHMFHDMTYNIDGVDYTFDSDGICQNPPSQASNSSNNAPASVDEPDSSNESISEDNKLDGSTQNQGNPNNEVDIEDTNNMPDISASIYGIINNDKNTTSKFILPKEAYNLRRYFMGIY